MSSTGYFRDINASIRTESGFKGPQGFDFGAWGPFTVNFGNGNTNGGPGGLPWWAWLGVAGVAWYVLKKGGR